MSHQVSLKDIFSVKKIVLFILASFMLDVKGEGNKMWSNLPASPSKIIYCCRGKSEPDDFLP